MQILKYANNYFAVILLPFSLLILRSDCAVVKFLSLTNSLLSHVMCHSGHITSGESSEHCSATGSKSGSERGLRGTMRPVATKTWVCNSYDVNEYLVSKLLLPRILWLNRPSSCASLRQQEAGSWTYFLLLVPLRHILNAKSLHSFWGISHRTVIPASLKFSLVLVYENSANAILGSRKWIILQACLRIPPEYSFPCS